MFIFRRKTWLVVFASIVAICAILFTAAVVVLRSDGFQKFAVTKVQRLLHDKAGIDASIADISIDPFRHVVIHNVKVLLKKPELGEIEASVADINLRYSLWALTKRKLEVSEVLVSGVRVRAVLAPVSKVQEAVVPSNPITLLLDLLDNPPITASIPHVGLKDLALDVKVQLPKGERISLMAEQIGADIALTMERGAVRAQLLSFMGELSNPPKINILAENFPGAPLAKIDGRIAFSFETSVALSSGVDSLGLSFEKEIFRLALAQTNIAARLKQQKIDLNINAINIEQSIEKSLEIDLKEFAKLRHVAPAEFEKALSVEVGKFVNTLVLKVPLSTAVSANNVVGSFAAPGVLLGASVDANTKINVVAGMVQGSPALDAFTLKADLGLSNLNGIPVKLNKRLGVQAEVAYLPKERGVEYSTSVTMGGAPLVDANGTVFDKPKLLEYTKSATIIVSPELRELHPAAAILNDVGGFEIAAKASGSIAHAAQTVLQFKPSMIKNILLKTSFDVAILQKQLPAFPTKLDLRLKKAHITGSAEWKGKGEADVSIKGAVAGVKVKDLARSLDTNFEVWAQANLPAKKYGASGFVDLDSRRLLAFNLDAQDKPQKLVTAGSVSVSPSLPQLSTLHKSLADLNKLGSFSLLTNFDAVVSHPFVTVEKFNPALLGPQKKSLVVDASLNGQLSLAGMSSIKPTLENAKLLSYLKVAEPYLSQYFLSLKAATDLKTRIVLERLKANTGEGRVVAEVSGKADMKGENADVSGVLNVALPPIVPLDSKTEMQTRGRSKIDWRLRRVGGNDVQISGIAGLQRVGISLGKIEVENISGDVPFSQELRVLPEKAIAWSHLLDLSPFLKVDTARVRPYLASAPVVRIERISAMDRNVGPLRARVSFSQNQLAFDDVDLSLFDGAYTGQVFVDVHPKALRVAILGRLAGLDTTLLTPGKKVAAGDSRYLGLRIATIVDIPKSLAEGRVDVNEIGSQQLKDLVQVLDPEGKDSALNAARMGLSAAYPKYVGLRMEQGYLDVVVELGGVAPVSINARQLPLTAILTPYTNAVMNSIREVPLK